MTLYIDIMCVKDAYAKWGWISFQFLMKVYPVINFAIQYRTKGAMS